MRTIVLMGMLAICAQMSALADPKKPDVIQPRTDQEQQNGGLTPTTTAPSETVTDVNNPGRTDKRATLN
jgi:hypothetical protein